MKRTTALRLLTLAVLASIIGVAYSIEPVATMAYLHSIGGSAGLAGLSFMAIGDTEMIKEIKKIIESQGDTFQQFQKRYDSRIDTIEKEIGDFLIKQGRPNLGGTGSSGANTPELKALQDAARHLILGNQQKANEAFMEAKAMSVGTGPDGGFVVHDVVHSGMTKVMAELSPVYRLARKIPLTTGTDFIEPLDRESAEANWVGETQSRSETDTPDLGMFRVSLKEICAMPKATQTLIDTASIDILGWLQLKIGDAFATKESDAYHNGDGVARPRGFLSFTTAATADDTRAWGTFQHVATGTSGAFPASNPCDTLIDVVTTLKPQYRNGAVWLMNRSTAAAASKFKDGEGRFIWQQSLLIGQPSTLLGYPVEIDEDMPDIAADSLSIAFGNVTKAYTIIEQPGTKFLTDPYTDKPNVRLFAYRRVGGGVNNFEALKFLKFSA